MVHIESSLVLRVCHWNDAFLMILNPGTSRSSLSLCVCVSACVSVREREMAALCECKVLRGYRWRPPCFLSEAPAPKRLVQVTSIIFRGLAQCRDGSRLLIQCGRCQLRAIYLFQLDSGLCRGDSASATPRPQDCRCYREAHTVTNCTLFSLCTVVGDSLCSSTSGLYNYKCKKKNILVFVNSMYVRRQSK